MKTIIKTFAALVILALAVSMFTSCKKVLAPSSPTGFNDVQCNTYRYVDSSKKTTLEDETFYRGTDKGPEYYENWFGVKATASGYLFYDCCLIK